MTINICSVVAIKWGVPVFLFPDSAKGHRSIPQQSVTNERLTQK